ncbi:MAG: branched-chain amino acid aminotransferase [Oscillospiraceae bacterium]|jgi:branched-chain amino acid aminotransferase|nr:branched-chain amino acid aminotransferase [Oscillospiraceae bacterium]
MNISITRTTTPKAKPADQSKLGFGLYYTDHMFLMNYDEGLGWHDPRIVPYGPISLDPAAMCLHYGQEVFEGLKAYRQENGDIKLFRPDRNYARLNLSNDRLCIPPIDEAFAIEATKELVKVDADWIPTAEGTSLYIRPYIFAVDAHVGVHPGKHLIFAIILSPVGAYYPEGLNPVKIYVESNYVRAVKGGMGFTKTGGNYASSLKAQAEAEKLGYTQVLWLDGVERRYIEEVGTMNVFFKIGGKVITPALQGSILGGVTRMSCIDILNSWGVPLEERAITIQEVAAAADAGTLEEVFGSGTAAVISPVGELRWGDKVIRINNGQIGALSQKLYDALTGIQWGKIPDTFGWTFDIN